MNRKNLQLVTSWPNKINTRPIEFTNLRRWNKDENGEEEINGILNIKAKICSLSLKNMEENRGLEF
jgi:hypothetical protein